ncbi:hypothetical protein SynA1560_01087 [Synechococcus sp. A15-60]|nr:hypothetical protein SynA1560_01087 [Synechococcus sp. A15-60]
MSCALSCLSPGFLFGNDAMSMQDLMSLSWWYLRGVLEEHHEACVDRLLCRLLHEE